METIGGYYEKEYGDDSVCVHDGFWHSITGAGHDTGRMGGDCATIEGRRLPHGKSWVNR